MAWFGRREWVPALGRWSSVEGYRRLMRMFSLDDLPQQMAADLDCKLGMRIIELGCGPGALSEAVHRRTAGVRYIGIDPDPRMLAYASTHSGADSSWLRGFAQDLPLGDNSVDRVSTTLVLHHLTPQQKTRALAEAHRILRPGGRLCVTDWTKPQGWRALSFLLVRAIDGFAQTADHAAGRLPALITAAGFHDLTALRRRQLGLGTITHFRATKPRTVAPMSQTAHLER